MAKTKTPPPCPAAPGYRWDTQDGDATFTRQSAALRAENLSCAICSCPSVVDGNTVTTDPGDCECRCHTVWRFEYQRPAES